ncbi:NAD(P)/FAD-dependent oxidoreductase [Roseibium sp. RKSG952]|uniref:NAD(P)/FAD-dependent oxidoreductase n=1 Tax=Roseibium sp. RKSG952 TaxID=2529384 RepID=UPI0013CCD5A6|nr:NAD(P)/FAD-dependent oxidoreductase [Roseibium sp. RKSG952]
MNSKHIVVVGGGFGGLQAVHDLAGAGVRITLIDQRNHHLFQPLLYQAATTILPISEIAWPLRRLLRQRKDVTTLLARVSGIDPETRRVFLERGPAVSYDMLVLATGARHSYFGHDDWEPYAPGLKTLEDATNIRGRVLSAFEAAESTPDEAHRNALMTFAVIGAGPTGVELVGVIAELAQRVLPSEFRNIDTRKARVLLVEAGEKVLPAFPEDLSGYARDALERLGVEVLTGQPVTSCDHAGITLGGQRIPSCTIIWAAGVQASDASRWLDVEADRAGRVVVAPDLTVREYPDVFVIGDTAAVLGMDGKPVPGIAPAAKQMGRYIAKVIRSRLAGKPAPKPFRYRHQGSLATVGRSAAVVDFGKFRLKGALAYWFWGFAHIYFLIGTRSRAIVAWSWLWSYLTGQNSARLITTPDVTRHASRDHGLE